MLPRLGSYNTRDMSQFIANEVKIQRCNSIPGVATKHVDDAALFIHVRDLHIISSALISRAIPKRQRHRNFAICASTMILLSPYGDAGIVRLYSHFSTHLLATRRHIYIVHYFTANVC